MIKLIASDVDGTLFQEGTQRLSKRDVEIINKLIDKGYIFVPCSGRQYPNLTRVFENVNMDKMPFVCENGALVMYEDKAISKSCFEKELAINIMKDILNLEEAEILVSAERMSYIQPRDMNFVKLLHEVVRNTVSVVDDVTKINDHILKISAFIMNGDTKIVWKNFHNKYKNLATIVESGNNWVDTIPFNINKATALATVAEKFNIKFDEIMAFGDNYNDIAMLKMAKYGYAMNNSPKDIYEHFNLHCDFVADVLEDFIKNPF